MALFDTFRHFIIIIITFYCKKIKPLYLFKYIINKKFLFKKAKRSSHDKASPCTSESLACIRRKPVCFSLSCRSDKI